MKEIFDEKIRISIITFYTVGILYFHRIYEYRRYFLTKTFLKNKKYLMQKNHAKSMSLARDPYGGTVKTDEHFIEITKSHCTIQHN